MYFYPSLFPCNSSSKNKKRNSPLSKAKRCLEWHVFENLKRHRRGGFVQEKRRDENIESL